MGANIQSIGRYAFSGCTNLVKIDFSNFKGTTPPIIEDMTALPPSSTKFQVKVPEKMLSVWKNAGLWAVLHTRIVSKFDDEV